VRAVVMVAAESEFPSGTSVHYDLYATTVFAAAALVGIVVGAPIGIAAGRVLWRVFATNFGVVPVPVVPLLTLTALAVGVLVAANVLAAVPALTAARSRPGQLPRTE
jgi:hypothetical protein